MTDTDYFHAAVEAYRLHSHDNRDLYDLLHDTKLFKQLVLDAQKLKKSAESEDWNV